MHDTSKDREEDSKIANMDANNAGFEILCKCLLRKEEFSTCLLDLRVHTLYFSE